MPDSGAVSIDVSPWRRVVPEPVRADGAAVLLWLPAMVAGGVLGWGASAPQAWPLSLLALVGLTGVVLITERRSARLGLVSVGLGVSAWALAGVGWVALAVRDGSHATAWRVAVLAILLLVQVGPLLLIWGLLAGTTRGRSPVAIVSRWVLCLAGAETLRQAGWWGSGYASLAAAFVDAPGAAAWVPVVGAGGWSWAVAAVAGGVALWLWFFTTGARPAARWTLAGTLLATALLSGWPARAWTVPRAGAEQTLRVIQPPLQRGERWTVQARDQALARLHRTMAAAPPGAVIVTSETYFPEPPPSAPGGAWGDLLRRAARTQVHLLLGMPHVLRDFDGLHLMNAVVQISPERQSLYAKERLVPGGEYLPWSDLLGPVYAEMFDNVRTGQRGAPAELTQPLFVAGQLVGASICHELAFSLTMAARARDVGWLANLADDAWIDSELYRRQMSTVARLRAMEAGKPLVRASHGGHSILVGPDGRLLGRSDLAAGEPWPVSLQPHDGQTPYHHATWWWAGLPLACAALWALLGLRSSLDAQPLATP